jgi:hypothetical protein
MVNEMIMFVLQVLVMYMAAYGIIDRICMCVESIHMQKEYRNDKSRNKEE